MASHVESTAGAAWPVLGQAVPYEHAVHRGFVGMIGSSELMAGGPASIGGIAGTSTHAYATTQLGELLRLDL